MSESIIEFNIKGYSVKIDKETITIFDKKELLLKVDYQQAKAILRIVISKINELKKQIETKE